MNTHIRAATRAILEKAEHYEWSLQGFGMLRCYLGSDRLVRLHVWDDRYAVSNVSTIHDHPWDFRSVIVSGEIRDRVFHPIQGRPATHHVQKIVCGPGGCALERESDVALGVRLDQTFRVGQEYSRAWHYLHESLPSRGAVSIIHRSFREQTEQARVLFPVGTEWVSAEPRAATRAEVADIVGHALSVWDA